MKIIKRIRLARVRYGDLDEGDRFYDCIPGFSQKHGDNISNCEILERSKYAELVCDYNKHDTVPVLDTDKYPPEKITWEIVGIEESALIPVLGNVGRGRVSLGPLIFSESGIEIIYE